MPPGPTPDPTRGSSRGPATGAHPTLPRDPHGVTAGWLEQALGERFPGVRVEAVEILETHEGTNAHARLAIRYAEPSAAAERALPDTMFLKMLPPDPERRATIEQTGMGRREALFYRSLADDVPMRVPRPWVARLDEASGEFVLLLEDLAGGDCRLADPVDGLTPEQAAGAMHDYAALHVRYEDARRREREAGWVTRMGSESDMGVWMLQYGLDHHRDKLRDGFAEMARLYIDQRAALDEIWSRGGTTVLQGDSHVGNLFLDGDRVGFLDWGLIQLGPPIRDVGYFVTMALSPANRRAHERALIRRYLDEREVLGGARIDFDEAWLMHRVHAAYAAPAACPLVLFPEDEPEENARLSRSFLERAQCVIEDLDPREALRAFAGL